MARRTYENKDIKVFWDSDKCIHSEHCVEGLPLVFDRKRKPWIDVDAAEAEAIMKVVSKCPSGALTCEYAANDVNRTSNDAPVIRVLRDGPYEVCGDVQLIGSDGNPIQTGQICALCRCGKSRIKPFCDGAHTRIGFKD